MKAVADTDDILTPQEVAQWLHVNPRQLYRIGVPARVLGHKTIRYVRREVLEWLQQQPRTREAR